MAVEMAVELTTGTMMFYGGIAAVAIGIVSALVCISTFPKQRKKRLEEISGD